MTILGYDSVNMDRMWVYERYNGFVLCEGKREGKEEGGGRSVSALRTRSGDVRAWGVAADIRP